jgi:hypothetical protein
MLYTFSYASTVAQVSADLAELRAALPAGAITGYSLALSSASQSVMGHGIHAASAVPYAILALLVAAVITASVAAAAVTAGYRRIGVLKSIGFTPAQIAATYLVQLGIPALAGALAGTVLGNRWGRTGGWPFPHVAGRRWSAPAFFRVWYTEIRSALRSSVVGVLLAARAMIRPVRGL